jgi:AcrR family transcriptional regulator
VARKKNQVERREQLVSAAIEAVLRHGAAGARLKDIAREAGLASASVLYYYPDVRELLAAVFEQGSRQYCERREARVVAAETPVEKLFACIRSGIPWPGATEEASRVLYELAPVVLRDELAAAGYRAFLERQTALYLTVLEEGEASGDFHLLVPAPALARSFVALEDGYSVEVLIGGMTSQEEEDVMFLHARAMVGLAQVVER